MTDMTKETLELANSGPAIFANGCFVQVQNNVVRLTFVEQTSPDAEPAFRGAILLALDTAVGFSALLEQVLGKSKLMSAPMAEGMVKH